MVVWDILDNIFSLFLGLNLYNRSPVFLDPYDDYKYTNGNCWIGGSSGAGKTFTLQCLGGRLRQQGRRILVIAAPGNHVNGDAELFHRCHPQFQRFRVVRHNFNQGMHGRRFSCLPLCHRLRLCHYRRLLLAGPFGRSRGGRQPELHLQAPAQG